MFSQYSWGDFLVFYLSLAAIFYAFVLWRFKRYDIRDWISSRGKKELPVAGVTDEEENEEEDVASKFYQVSSYSGSQSKPVYDTGDSSRQAAQTKSQVPSTKNDQVAQPVELSEAEIVVDDQPSGFELPILVEGYRPQEQSMDEILETAKGLVVDEKGVVAPSDPADKKAAKLAIAVNEQQGNRVFGDMTFNR